MSGVAHVLNMGYVDREKIGLNGQSWGGYQTAYLITRTDLFACAMAGAPVSNMTSAYGGIRWGTGLSRTFQYERSQSRIGATLWEKPFAYLENSPLFQADKIKTPLLIMHNDKDGAVPWYQGIELYNALRRFQRPVWMLTYNGEDHNLVETKNKKDLSVRMQQFYDYYLKYAPMPYWMKYGVPATEKTIKRRFELVEEK
jgi:dipeptidyl aminopeptidase/acylaminoacyl peptidase